MAIDTLVDLIELVCLIHVAPTKPEQWQSTLVVRYTPNSEALLHLQSPCNGINTFFWKLDVAHINPVQWL